MVSTVYIISWRYFGCWIALVWGSWPVDPSCTLPARYHNDRFTGIMLQLR